MWFGGERGEWYYATHCTSLLQNCFTTKFWEAPAFVSVHMCQSSRTWESKGWGNTDNLEISSFAISNPHPLTTGMATFHKEEKSPSTCSQHYHSVYDTIALECFPFGLSASSEEEEGKMCCLVSCSSICVCKMSLPLDDSNLKYRLALTKLTQAGFSLWWFQFQAYSS